MTPRSLFTAVVALAQLVCPLAAHAAGQYEYMRAVPRLTVSPPVPPAPSAGNGETAPAPAPTPAPAPAPKTISPRWSVEQVNFEGVRVGSTATQQVRLHNDGNETADFRQLSGLTAAFTADASACASVTGGGSCVVSVTFAPSAAGSFTATNIAPSAGQPVNRLALSGQGLTVAAELSTHALDFGNQTVGTSSAVKTGLLTNTGNTALTLGALTVTGPFEASTSCPTTLPAGANCLVNVVFKPTAAGAASGSVKLTSEAGTQTLALSGFGAIPLTAALSSSWSSVDAPTGSFPATAMGSSSSLMTFVVPSGNVGALSIGATLSGSSDFRLVSAQKIHVYSAGGSPTYEGLSCGATVSATNVANCLAESVSSTSAQLALTVQFTPTSIGSKSATLSVTHNGTNASPLVLGLTGTGQGVATAELSTATLAFGSTTLVGSTATASVRLTNNGAAALSLTGAPSLTGNAAFTLAPGSTSCGSSLPIGGYCDTVVSFTPTGTATVTGTLSFATSVGTKTVALNGAGLLPLTTLLLHFDSSVADVYLHSASLNSNVTFNTTSAWNTGAAQFNGSSSRLGYTGTADFTFGTGDFTLEAWVNPSSYTAGTYGRTILDFRPDGVNGVYPTMLVEKSSGRLLAFTNDTTVATGATPVPLNTWSHVAWSRNNGVSRLYLNGTLTASFNDSYNYGNPGSVKVGTNAFYAPVPSTGWHGSIDEVRVTKGTGRYPGNFSMPTAPFAQ